MDVGSVKCPSRCVARSPGVRLASTHLAGSVLVGASLDDVMEVSGLREWGWTRLCGEKKTCQRSEHGWTDFVPMDVEALDLSIIYALDRSTIAPQ